MSTAWGTSGARGLRARLEDGDIRSKPSYAEGMSRELILVVEDDSSIAAGLQRALGANDYASEIVVTGSAAIDRAAVEPRLDLILLDLGLPDLDGVEVCRRIRAIDQLVPIVILTARREEIDIVIGLDAGALDYVTKPFRLAELMARLRVQLRRPAGPTARNGATALIEIGDIEIDLAARRVQVGGAEVDLRAKEFDLLAVLMANPGVVLTREQIMEDVWDEHWFGSTKTLDVHIASLRRRLGEAPGTRSRIATLRGVGYRFELTHRDGVTAS